MKQLGSKIFLFVIAPFLSFLHSFSKPWSPSSRVIIFLWFVTFGLCFTPSNKDADSWRYAEEFKIESRSTGAQFEEQISDYFHNYQTTSTRDIYIVTMTYVISRVSSNIHLFFMALAFVFAFFYVGSMKFVTPLPKEKYDTLVIPILFLLFCLSNPIFNINGVRFWTAAWVAIYVLFNVLVHKRYMYLFLAPVTVLIHASFVIFIIILAVYFLLGRIHKLWIVLFIISLFFAILSLGPTYDLGGLASMPLFMESEMDAYASDSAIMDKQLAFQNLPLYARILNMLPRIIINTILVLLFIKRKEISNKQEDYGIFDFMIVLMTFVNFTFVIPSVGVRFFRLVLPFLVFVLIQNPSFVKQYKVLIYCLPIAFSVEILYWFRNMASVTSIIDYIAPFPYLLIHYLF